MTLDAFALDGWGFSFNLKALVLPPSTPSKVSILAADRIKGSWLPSFIFPGYPEPLILLLPPKEQPRLHSLLSSLGLKATEAQETMGSSLMLGHTFSLGCFQDSLFP